MRATSGPLRKRHPWELRDVTVDDDELTTRVRAALSAGCEARADQIDSGFTADLALDSDGLVIDYPPHWTRSGNRSRD